MFINRFRNNNTSKGFTLIETLVVLALFSLFAIVIADSISNTLSFNVSVNTEFSMENNMQYAISYMRKIIRNGSTSTLTSINSEMQNPSSSNPFVINNILGKPIAKFYLSNVSINGISSSYIGYIAPGNSSIQITSPKQLNITKLDFYYYNYNLSGSSSISFTPKIAPYITIYMQGCTLHKFVSYGSRLCLNLVSSVTLENYVYSKQ